MAINLQRLTSTCISLLFFSLPALAWDNYKEFKRDHWDFEASTEFFRSEANYPSSGGGSQNLNSGNYFQTLDFTFGTRYMPRQTWSIFAEGTVSNAESKDSLATRTNSSFSEAQLGVDFVMYSDLFQMIPEVVVVIPTEKVNSTSDTVLNSEGVMEVRSRLLAQKDFGTWRGYGWLGFNYRGDGRSFLMPWGVGVQMKKNRFRWGGELFGYQSISDDTDKNSTTRTAYINGVNAGSLKYYGTNPALMDTQVFATWLISPKWSMQVNGGMTLMGSNSAAGFHAGGVFRYSFDMSEGYVEEPPVAPIDSPVPSYRSNMYNSELGSEKKVNQFREDTADGVQQDIFKARPTQKPVPKRVKDKQLQQQLDQTEFDIELKSKKKRKNR